MADRLATIRGEVNPILTKLAKGYTPPQKLIAKRAAPLVESPTESGTLYSFGKEGFYLYNTERALRANAKQISFAIGKDTYICKEHALESPLDYAELDQAEKIGGAQILKLKKRALGIVQQSMAIELEKAVADVLFSTTYYASGNYETLSGTDQWSHSSSDPIAKIDTAREAAAADMGVEPNTMVIGYTAYRALAKHADIKAMVSDNKDKPIVLNPNDMAALLGFDQILVGTAIYSTDAGVFTRIWSDSAALIYLPTTGEMTEGTTPHTVIIEEMGYPIVKEFANKETVDVQQKLKYTVKNVDTSFGYLFADCVA